MFAEETAQAIVIGKYDLLHIGGLALFFQRSILPRPPDPLPAWGSSGTFDLFYLWKQ
jgi:hypothetical protein